MEIENLEAHRPALTGHCYRMLGSVFDAEDAVQETMIRAWGGMGKFDGRASIRTWLYRIATNVCLDEIKSRGRRLLPIEEGAPSSGAPPPEALGKRPHDVWIEPILDTLALPLDADPSTRAMLRQSIRLAFVAALQSLPPKQRAALLLMEVLGFSAAESAELLEMSLASVNSAVQRARTTLAARRDDQPADLTEPQRQMLEQYVAAFESYDLDRLTALMRSDVTMCMPPYSLWLQGPAEIRKWFLGHGLGCRGSRLVPTEACGWAAFAQYRPGPAGGHRAWALIVLELLSSSISGITSFLDTATLFPKFGLPLTLESPER